MTEATVETVLWNVNEYPSRVRDYFSLLKPRVMSLVIFTGLCGLLAAPGDIHPFIGALAVFCIALGSGAAGAINMWYDRDIDAIMLRTQKRPLPQKQMDPTEALHFGVFLSAASVFIMMVAVNYVAAALLAAAILFYVFIYTAWLKRKTPQNIVIGGAAGAFPPMIGWAAVTGNVSLESFVLFLIIFMWTPPHFWALSLFRSGDYTKANIPMLPVVKGRRSTQNHILFYTCALVPITLLPYALQESGLIYFVSALLLGIRFIFLSFRVYKRDEEMHAKKLFGYSIVYLFLIFTALVLDHWFVNSIFNGIKAIYA